MDQGTRPVGKWLFRTSFPHRNWNPLIPLDIFSYNTAGAFIEIVKFLSGKAYNPFGAQVSHKRP